MLKNAYYKIKLKNRCSIVSEPLFVSGGCMEARLPDPRVITPTYYNNIVEFVSSAKCVLLLLKKKTTINVLFVCLFHLYPPVTRKRRLRYVLDGSAPA